MSYVTSLYHIVFSTHNRRPTLGEDYRGKLYAVIATTIKDCGCIPILINGTADHVHILMGLSPSVALADMMRDLKSKTSVWVQKSGYFPLFNGWESEYGAFSLSYTHKQAVYDYIASQEEHHASSSLDQEYDRLIVKAGLTRYRFPGNGCDINPDI